MRFLPRLLKRCPAHYDLIVCGRSLSAYIAAASAIDHGLRVLWLPGAAVAIDPDEAPGFDSLAPEGVRYLSHILTEEQINRLSLGTFDGIHRGADFEPFAPILGRGMQLSVGSLKALLRAKITAHALVLEEGINDREVIERKLHVTTDTRRFSCLWIINAQGKVSDLSTQPIEYLSDDLWIAREYCDNATAIRNQVFFIQTDGGWQWLAYDAEGKLCKTYWQKQPDGNTQPLMNARWYRRPSFAEPSKPGCHPVLLTAPTCFRFDPSCGLGATLAIKTALLAVRCIRLSKARPACVSHYVKQFEYALEESFNEILAALRRFYGEYGG